MRKVIGLLLILAALYGARELFRYWEEVKARHETRSDRAASPPVESPGVLPGLPPALESSLQTAKQQGPASLKVWLGQYRPYVSDPRLAQIELDYIVLLGASRYDEARAIYEQIWNRTPTNSPIYPRVKQLEKTYR